MVNVLKFLRIVALWRGEHGMFCIVDEIDAQTILLTHLNNLDTSVNAKSLF